MNNWTTKLTNDQLEARQKYYAQIDRILVFEDKYSRTISIDLNRGVITVYYITGKCKSNFMNSTSKEAIKRTDVAKNIARNNWRGFVYTP